MEREIKFRGLSIKHECWAYGSLYVDIAYEKPRYYIIVGSYNTDSSDTLGCFVHEVIPSTVGQFIERKDKNGADVFAGDIFTTEDYPFHSEGNLNYVGVVEYDSKPDFMAWTYDMVPVSTRVRGCACGGCMSDVADRELTVIGNIHTTPELLEGGQG